MVMLREDRRVEFAPPNRRNALIEWSVGLVGALAVIVGAWMYHGPAGGEPRVLWKEFDVSGPSEAWPLGLSIVGGLLAFAGFGTMARRMFFRDDEYTAPIVTGTLVAIAGLVTAVAYLVAWII